MQILDAPQTLGNGRLPAFSAARGKALTDVSMSRLLTHLQIAATPHGIPSSVRDQTPWRVNGSAPYSALLRPFG